MNSRMDEEQLKAIYKNARLLLNRYLGCIKNLGFRGFSVRGKEKVAGEFSQVCATRNIKKNKAIFRGMVRPKSGKWAINSAV
jgi:DDE family transposase